MLVIAILTILPIFLILFKVYIKLTTGKCTSNARLEGKTVIVTGANTGIGKATALDIAKRGAKVILACRNLKAAGQAKEDIIRESGNKNVMVRKVDMASLASIREFSKIFHASENRLDILVNNAGASYLGNGLTEDGINATMQVNYFGPFLLTNLLIDLLKKNAPSRIVNVSSMLHAQANLDLDQLTTNENRNNVTVYCNSKLCNLLMSNELARRLEGSFVTSNSLHPGIVNTQLFKNMPWIKRLIMEFFVKIFFKSVEEGAQTSIYLAVSEEVKHISGEYFADCIPEKVLESALDEDLAKKLWERSKEIVKLQTHEIFL